MKPTANESSGGRTFALRIFLAVLALAGAYVLTEYYGISAYVRGHVAAFTGEMKSARELWLESHKSGFPPARSSLENTCVNPYSLPKSSRHWWAWCMKTVTVNRNSAFVYLGLALLDPNGKERNPRLGLSILRHQALTCNPSAARQLGKCYELAVCGLTRSDALALQWYKVEARYGVPFAAQTLWLKYGARGPGSMGPTIVEPDIVEAVSWWMVWKAYAGASASEPRAYLAWNYPELLTDDVIASARSRADEWLSKYPPDQTRHIARQCIGKSPPPR